MRVFIFRSINILIYNVLIFYLQYIYVAKIINRLFHEKSAKNNKQPYRSQGKSLRCLELDFILNFKLHMLWVESNTAHCYTITITMLLLELL